MGIYVHPRDSRLRVAYTWFGTRMPTPAWFDDIDNEIITKRRRLGTAIFLLWARCRALGIVKLRYWGRA